MSQVRDVTKEARKALRERKRQCPHQTTKRLWEEKGAGKYRYEKCSQCGERFPCKETDCPHFDCAEVQINRGLRIDYPDHVTVTIEDDVGRVLFDNVFDEE